MTSYKPVGDSGLMVTLGSEPDDDVRNHIAELDYAVSNAGIAGVREVIPALVNLLVVFDPIVTDPSKVRSAIENLFPLEKLNDKHRTEHLVEVCYGGDFGPDLTAVAKSKGISDEALVDFHTSCKLKVGMYGFAPGYAYLTGLPEVLQVPRKVNAVPDVEAGSVIIAGSQCLITTLTMPTGWNIIGRTHMQILTDDPTKPFSFEVGDTVTFKEVSEEAFAGSKP